MSKRKEKESRRVRLARRSDITRHLLFRYILSLTAFFAGFFICLILAIFFCQTFIWYPEDPFYQFLNWIQTNLILVSVVILLIGFMFISYRMFAKSVSYLDETISASEQLAHPTEVPISLSPRMKNVEVELNMVREQALRNALIAKEAEQRKNDMLVYLAHDLKTPLTSVIGYLNLLHDEEDISPALREKYTDIALDKAERLEDLINEFFDITRFNLTALTLEPERRSLSRMLEQITSEFLPILSEKSLTWNTSIAPNVEIVCDPDKLERVFDNLIRNAVNYSYSGTEITLNMTPLPRFVEIRVQNQGKTIPPEKLEKIFEQFFRLDSSRSSATGGAGLGLAISKEIVELHGGTIKAESSDETILFTVRLPFDCRAPQNPLS